MKMNSKGTSRKWSSLEENEKLKDVQELEENESHLKRMRVSKDKIKKGSDLNQSIIEALKRVGVNRCLGGNFKG